MLLTKLNWKISIVLVLNFVEIVVFINHEFLKKKNLTENFRIAE
jgi:hypothetical protein